MSWKQWENCPLCDSEIIDGANKWGDKTQSCFNCSFYTHLHNFTLRSNEPYYVVW